MGSEPNDGLRSLALAGTCAAFVAVPTLGALLGEGEQTRDYDTVITPPDYAFAIWGPIFAASAAATVAQCRPGGRTAPLSRRTGWPLASAFAVNTAWSVAAQTGRFAATPSLLPVATAGAAVAYARLVRAPADPAGPVLTPVATGLLLGWTALASTVNLAAGAVAAGADRNSPRLVTGCVAALLTASTAVAGAVAAGRRGQGWTASTGRHAALSLAVGSGWGLATTAFDSRRPRSVRAAAAAGALLVGAAALGRGAPGIGRRR